MEDVPNSSIVVAAANVTAASMRPFLHAVALQIVNVVDFGAESWTPSLSVQWASCPKCERAQWNPTLTPASFYIHGDALSLIRKSRQET